MMTYQLHILYNYYVVYRKYHKIIYMWYESIERSLACTWQLNVHEFHFRLKHDLRSNFHASCVLTEKFHIFNNLDHILTLISPFFETGWTIHLKCPDKQMTQPAQLSNKQWATPFYSIYGVSIRQSFRICQLMSRGEGGTKYLYFSPCNTVRSWLSFKPMKVPLWPPVATKSTS